MTCARKRNEVQHCPTNLKLQVQLDETLLFMHNTPLEYDFKDEYLVILPSFN